MLFYQTVATSIYLLIVSFAVDGRVYYLKFSVNTMSKKSYGGFNELLLKVLA